MEGLYGEYFGLSYEVRVKQKTEQKNRGYKNIHTWNFEDFAITFTQGKGQFKLSKILNYRAKIKSK